MHKDTPGEGKYLGFVLQTTERGRENQTVIVAFEFRTVVMSLGVPMLLSESFIRDKLLPIHHI